MKRQQPNKQVVIYQTKTGALELKTDLQAETIWLTQQQVAELFDVQKAAISKHVRAIFDSSELERKATVSKMETVQKEGARSIKRIIEYYNLDLVLSIGYRVNSKKATHFRQWATKILKSHVLKGYTINRHRIKTNYEAFLQAVADVKNLLPTNSIVDNESVFELVTLFADTWFSLDAYDKDALVTTGATKKKVKITAEKLSAALAELKQVLIAKGEATDIFGVERTKDSVAGIVGNVMQSFDKQELYPTIEEKVAHLLDFK